MTVCLYISPPDDRPGSPPGSVIPVLLADTLATFESIPEGVGSLLPANATAEVLAKPSRTSLVRKLNIFGDYAWACAGRAKQIRDMAYELRMQAEDWQKLDRPMRRLGDISSAVGIQSIGAHVSGGRINVVAPHGLTQIPHLGECAVAGSGSDEVLGYCVEQAQNFDRYWGPTNSIEKILGFVSALNGVRLAKEMLGENKNGWGGYLEWAFHDGGAWRRGPKTLNLFFRSHVEGDKVAIDIINRAVAYDPGKGTGRILSLSEDSAATFELENMIVDKSDSDILTPATWEEWAPEWVNVTIIHTHPDGHLGYVSRSFWGGPDSPVIFNYADGNSQFGVEMEMLNVIAGEMVAAMNGEYLRKGDSEALPPAP